MPRDSPVFGKKYSSEGDAGGRAGQCPSRGWRRDRLHWLNRLPSGRLAGRGRGTRRKAGCCRFAGRSCFGPDPLADVLYQFILGRVESLYSISNLWVLLFEILHDARLACHEDRDDEQFGVGAEVGPAVFAKQLNGRSKRTLQTPTTTFPLDAVESRRGANAT